MAAQTSPGSVVSLASARDADDLAAVERCLAGNGEAFAVIVRRYSSGVYALCVRMVGRSLAEELAQEAFTRAYANLGGFRRDAQLRHWLYRIALNICRDHRKSGRAREEPVAEFSASSEPTDAAGDPERRTIHRDALRALDAAIARLPPKYREAFVLKHLENLSYQDIRAVVRMPIPALKVRVHRARELLKRMLGEHVTGP